MAPRVLITRAPHQASALAAGLRAVGLEPILIPTIEIAPPTSFATLEAALAVLPSYHWIVFTSANAVDAFFRRAVALTREAAPSSLIPAPCLTAAIGPGTARALEPFGIKPALVPARAIAESLAEALISHALQPDGSPTRFLIPSAEAPRDHLASALTASGSHVTVAPVYRNVIPAGSIPAIRSLFEFSSSYPNAITFTSGSTVNNLLALLDASALKLPPGVLRISIGPITSAALAEAGFPAHAQAGEATIQSLVQKTSEALFHMKSGS